jgi:hypothetical protein
MPVERVLKDTKVKKSEVDEVCRFSIRTAASADCRSPSKSRLSL